MAKARLVSEIVTKGARKGADDLDNYTKSAGGAERGAGKLSKTLTFIPKAFAAVSVAATAAGAAILLASRNSSEARREMQALATVAGESADEFEALAFASDTVGISAEKLSDISKDVNEKLGEFVSTGGGGFKDFFEEVAPLVGVTANELQNLSGPEVLQRVKNAMDEANISMEEQSFFLESIASDTTLLIPLLANQGAELENLTSQYKNATAALQLTVEESKSLEELATSFDLITEQSGKAITFLTAKFAPELKSVLEFVVNEIPKATNEVFKFFDSFRDPENRQSIEGLQESLADNVAEIERLNRRIFEAGALGDPNSQFVQQLNAEIKNIERENIEIDEQIKLLQERQEIANLPPPVVQPQPSRTVDTESQKLQEQAEKRLEVLRSQAEAFLAETDKLGRTRLELIEIQEAERLDTLREFANQGLIEFADFEEAKTRILQDSANQRRQVLKEEADLILSSGEQLFGSLAELTEEFGGRQSTAYKALFAVQKAFSIAQAVLNLSTAASQAAADPTALTPAQKFSNIALVTSEMTNLLVAIKSASFSPRQQGGQFRAGQQLLVGEKGPELLEFSQGGRIESANDTANLLTKEPSITIINQTQGRIDQVDTMRDDKGDMILVAKQVMNEEVLNPNSQFNRNLDRTRKIERQL